MEKAIVVIDSSRSTRVELRKTVAQCKLIVESDFGVPHENQRLCHNSKILTDENRTLSQLGVQREETVEVWEPGEIEIALITGRTFSTWVEPSYTVDQLRSIIAEESSFHVHDIRLIFAGRDVWDYDRQLAGWGIKTGSKVHCVLRLRNNIPCSVCESETEAVDR